MPAVAVVQPMVEADVKARSKLCTVMAISDPAIDVVEDCTVLQFGKYLLLSFQNLFQHH